MKINNDKRNGVERELKFAVAASDIKKLTSIPLLKRGKASEKELTSIYFDSSSNALMKAGMSLRVRSVSGGLIHSLKLPTSQPDGLFVRREYEIESSDRRPNIDRFGRHMPARLRQQLETGLRPVFLVQVTRKEWSISMKADEVALSVDKGFIRAGERREPVCELEIELRRGDETALFELARRIAKIAPLRLEVFSKAERGYRLAEGTSIAARKMPRPRLRCAETTAAGFEVLASSFIRHFSENEEAFLATRSAESVHQMRVALRRLRSLASFCEDLLSKRERSAFGGGIKRVWKLLGAARDLDIAIAMLELRQSNGKRALFELRRKRDAASGRLLAELRSRRFCLCMLDLLAFSRRVRQPGSGAFAPVASRTLQLNWRELRIYDLASGLTKKERHRLRLRAKALRYAAECFADLFPKHNRRRDRFIDALERLQDALGKLNDRATTRRLLRRLFGAEGAKLIEDAASQGRSNDALLEDAETAQKRLRASRPYWR